MVGPGLPLRRPFGARMMRLNHRSSVRAMVASVHLEMARVGIGINARQWLELGVDAAKASEHEKANGRRCWVLGSSRSSMWCLNASLASSGCGGDADGGNEHRLWPGS